MIVITAVTRLALASHVRNSIFMKLTKGCQTPPSGFIARVVRELIHPDQLEDEISQGGEQDSHDESHGNLLLPPGAPSREDQECDGEREYGNREVKFVVPTGTGNRLGYIAWGGGDDDNKLDGETDEEEEIEFEKSDKNLKSVILAVIPIKYRTNFRFPRTWA